VPISTYELDSLVKQADLNVKISSKFIPRKKNAKDENRDQKAL